MPVGTDEEAPLGDFIEDSRVDLGRECGRCRVHARRHRSGAAHARRPRATVVRLRYGLDDGRPRTLDEIGRVFGISRERVRQIERDSMAKLRTGDRSEVLRAYAS